MNLLKTLIILISLLAGCTKIPGVAISDDERKTCEAETCSVWTKQELMQLIHKAYQKGYKAGVESI